MLDIGTGSGILAISASKLGYSPVHAIDFDFEAVRIARNNARRNRVENHIRISHQDLTRLPVRPKRTYSVICANLISSLLLANRRLILVRLQPFGVLVVAGILSTEFEAVKRAYGTAGLRLVASRAEGEWRSGAFSRRD
jgi:ribosomal protein L11 methyltransferase